MLDKGAACSAGGKWEQWAGRSAPFSASPHPPPTPHIHTQIRSAQSSGMFQMSTPSICPSHRHANSVAAEREGSWKKEKKKQAIKRIASAAWKPTQWQENECEMTETQSEATGEIEEREASAQWQWSHSPAMLLGWYSSVLPLHLAARAPALGLIIRRFCFAFPFQQHPTPHEKESTGPPGACASPPF